MNPPENNGPDRRRRRPLGFVGTAVTTALAVYGTYHLAMWAWNTWNAVSGDDECDDHDHDHANDTEKKPPHHQNTNSSTNTNTSNNRHRVTVTAQIQQRRCMAQCRRQTAATLAAFNTILLEKIEAGTETTIVRRQLKEIRKLQSDDTKHQESILWMTIQVETVTRLMTMAYATTLLYTTLTIQVYRLGGRMYHNNNNNNNNTNHSAGFNPNGDELSSSLLVSLESQEALLLRSYDAFWERDGGLEELLEFVRSAVQTALKSWNIHDPTFALQMSVAQVEQAMAQIRTTIEAKGDLLPRFIIMNDTADNDVVLEPATMTTGTSSKTSTNNDLLNEMYDLLESPVANDALRDALQCVFTILQEQYIAPIFTSNNNNSSSSSSSSNEKSNNHDHGHDSTQQNVVRPLPHVISQFKGLTNRFIVVNADHHVNHNNNSTSSRGSSNHSCSMYIAAMEQLPTIQEAARSSFGSAS